MRTIPAAEFKAHAWQSSIASTRTVVTKTGPAGREAPAARRRFRVADREPGGKLEIKGDVLSTVCAGMLNLDTHIVLHALAGSLTRREEKLLRREL